MERTYPGVHGSGSQSLLRAKLYNCFFGPRKLFSECALNHALTISILIQDSRVVYSICLAEEDMLLAEFRNEIRNGIVDV